MNREQADIVAGGLVTGILLLGIIGVVQLQLTGGPMRSGTDSLPLLAIIGPLLMSLLVASVVAGIYVFVRGQVFAAEAGEAVPTGTEDGPDDGTDPDAGADGGSGGDAGPSQPDIGGRHRLLEVLPDDERRILEPVIESPGLTQIEVRDRSEFSRSKVSQTVTDLEERGLLYRESQGRTYRVYPADDLDERL